MFSTQSSWSFRYDRINTPLPFVSGDLRERKLLCRIRKEQTVEMKCRNPRFPHRITQPLTAICSSGLRRTAVETVDSYRHRLHTHTHTYIHTILIKIQPDATVCRYLFTAKSLYMFRVSQHPSSGVLKAVTVASGTGHNICTATSLKRGTSPSRPGHDGGK